jgi:hypothetical protein
MLVALVSVTMKRCWPMAQVRSEVKNGAQLPDGGKP